MPDTSLPTTDRSAVARRKRRLLVLESEQLRERSAWLAELREQVPAAAKAGFAAGQRNSLVNNFDYALIIVAILAAVSTFTPDLNWAFGLYAVLALALRTPSQRIFTAGMLSLLLTPISIALQRHQLANDFIIMALYFLCVGLVRIAVEKLKPGGERGGG